jgi:hypothetical protein
VRILFVEVDVDIDDAVRGREPGGRQSREKQRAESQSTTGLERINLLCEIQPASSNARIENRGSSASRTHAAAGG